MKTGRRGRTCPLPVFLALRRFISIEINAIFPEYPLIAIKPRVNQRSKIRDQGRQSVDF
jgi:hypothetical protein